MCLGGWSRAGLVDPSDLQTVTAMPALEDNGHKEEDMLMPEGYESIGANDKRP